MTAAPRRLLFALAALLLISPALPVAAQEPLHPDTSGPEWEDLFAPDLSNAIRPGGVWTFEDGVLTASEDEMLWTGKVYDDFVVDLEFRTAEATNSGVIVYVSDLSNWIPNSVEIQILDDYDEEWADAPDNWKAGAIFGHVAPRQQTVKQPGEWNRFTITCRGPMITVAMNDALVNVINMERFTSATTNPDGSAVPEWLSRPLAEIPTFGHVGLQGKHGNAPIWFRNLKIKELD